MKTVLISLIGSYLGVVALVYVFQRNLMYAPGHDVVSPQAAGVPEMSVHKLSVADGLEITSWYAPPKSDNKSVVVLFQGNAGTISSRAFKARYFLDAGLGVMLVGYRGYSDNPGTPNEKGLYMDARAALMFLTEQGVSSDQWVLYGESLGCAIAVQMAFDIQHDKITGQNSPSALILEAPFTSMGDVAAHHYPWLPARLLVRDHYDSFEKIPSLNVALLVVHGEGDSTIPQSQGKALFNLASEPKDALWIEGAGHNNLFDYGVGPAMVEWVLKAHAKLPL